MIIFLVHPYLDEVQVGQHWRNTSMDRVVTVCAIYQNWILYGYHGNDRTYELSYDEFCQNFVLEIDPV